VKNNSNSLSRFYWYLFQLCKINLFWQFFCLCCTQPVSDVGSYQTICWKNTLYRCWTSKANTLTRCEIAEVVWEWLFSVCCAYAC